MLCKHLKTTGEDWYLYVNPCCYALHTYVSPSTGYSAYELVYLHKQQTLLKLLIVYYSICPDLLMII